MSSEIKVLWSLYNYVARVKMVIFFTPRNFLSIFISKDVHLFQGLFIPANCSDSIIIYWFWGEKIIILIHLFLFFYKFVCSNLLQIHNYSCLFLFLKTLFLFFGFQGWQVCIVVTGYIIFCYEADFHMLHLKKLFFKFCLYKITYVASCDICMTPTQHQLIHIHIHIDVSINVSWKFQNFKI